MTKHPEKGEIESKFEQLNTQSSGFEMVELYQGRHVYGQYEQIKRYKVCRYDDGEEHLRTETTRKDDGETVAELDREWSLTDDGDHVQHSGESIEEFCRANHDNPVTTIIDVIDSPE